MLIPLVLASLVQIQSTPLPPSAPVAPRATPVTTEPTPNLSEVNWRVSDIEYDGDRVFITGEFRSIGLRCDSLFELDGPTGEYSARLPRVAGRVRATHSDGAGGRFVAFDGAMAGTDATSLVWIRADGSIDDSLPQVNRIRAMDYDPSTRRLYIIGNFTTVAGFDRYGGAAIEVPTGTVTAWAPRLIHGNGVSMFHAVKVAGGRVWIGGSDLRGPTDTSHNLVRCGPNSGIFDPIDFEVSDTVFTLASDGTRVLVGGSFYFVHGALQRGLAAFDAITGQLDPLNLQLDGRVSDLSVDGTELFLAGLFSQAGGLPREAFAVVDLNTETTTPWNPAVGFLSSFGSGFGVCARGNRVLVAGSFDEVAGQTRRALALLDRTTGAPVGPPLEFTSDQGGLSGFDSLDADGDTFVVAGVGAFLKSPLLRTVAAIDAATGQVDTGWSLFLGWDRGTHLEAGPAAIYVTGHSDDVPARLFARRRTTGGPLSGFSAELSGLSTFRFKDILATDQSLYAITQTESPDEFRILSFDPLTGQRQSIVDFGPHPGTANALEILPDGRTLIVGGDFQQIGSPAVARGSLAAIDTVSGAVLPWAPQDVDRVVAIESAPGAVYVLGEPGAMLSSVRDHAMAFDPATAALLPWAPPLRLRTGTSIGGLSFNAGRVLMTGQLESFGGQPVSSAVFTDGLLGTTLPWAPPTRSLFTLDTYASGGVWVNGRPVIAGMFNVVSSQVRSHIAWFTAGS